MSHSYSVSKFVLLAALFAFSFHSALSAADEKRFELGVRANAESAGGEPANDILGFGISGRYRLSQNWWLGASVDIPSYDYERPAKTLNIVQDTTVSDIDASVDATNVMLWLERRYGVPASTSQWFWNAGLGFGSVDVDDASGPTQAGGTFNITTDAGTETLLMLGAGYLYNFNDSWVLESSLSVVQHFADWEVRDTITGITGTVDDYTALGIHFGVNYRFC